MIRYIVVAVLIGVACGLLQPNQPQSAIAAACLSLAAYIAMGG